jgi:hypothetical protein
VQAGSVLSSEADAAPWLAGCMHAPAGAPLGDCARTHPIKLMAHVLADDQAAIRTALECACLPWPIACACALAWACACAPAHVWV